jgi:bifunctional N-acetylglucosamine-1-phosphate-uridyltransferase/glucosamine-1-phosphate-acetyltransferase GlmU-like protein
MLDRVLQLHEPTIDRAIVVVAPSGADLFEHYRHSRRPPVDLVVQPAPTGMLDAILVAASAIARDRPRRIAITWCDQIAVSAQTVRRVADRALANDAAALVLATLIVESPYVHFDRDDDGRIVGVRERREGHDMPVRGETDIGLFDLSLDAWQNALPRFAATAAPASGTGERNFLPFIPWLASHEQVDTVRGLSPIEAVGVNTPDELAAVESHLLGRMP